MLTYNMLLEHSSELIDLYKCFIPSSYYLNKLTYTPVFTNACLVMQLNLVLDNNGTESKHIYFISNSGRLMAHSSIDELTRLIQVWLNRLQKPKIPLLFDSGVLIVTDP